MSRIVRICIQSLQKVLIRPKKCFCLFLKFNMGIKKRLFHADIKFVEKVCKKLFLKS
jgi:hypothetical protein